MKFTHIAATAIFAGAIALTGCIDDRYDLKDIDGAFEVKVNDLVLPLRMDTVTLSSILKPDSTSVFRVYGPDSTYVIVASGDYESKEVEIDHVRMTRPVTDSKTITLPSIRETVALAGLEATEYDFHYHVNGIDDYIESVDSLYLDNFTIQMRTTFSEDGVTLTNPTYQFPAGLKGTVQIVNHPEATCSYNDKTGVLACTGTLPGGVVVKMVVTAIDMKAAGAKFNFAEHSYDFQSTIVMTGGRVSCNFTDPATFQMTVAYDLSDIEVIAVTGTIHYEVDIDEDTEFDITDIPEEISDSTDIGLQNPQVYIRLNNPLHEYGVKAQTGLRIIPFRENAAGQIVPDMAHIAELTRPLTIEGNEETVTFCLSETRPAQFYNEYPDAKWFELRNLGNVLRGDGIPKRIKVEFINPQAPSGTHVTHLPVGTNIGTIHGHYTLFAPLALSAGSKLIYSSKIENLDINIGAELNIKTLSVDADVKSLLPVSVELFMEPLGADGKIIPDVQFQNAIIPAYEMGSVKIGLSGSIENLKAIRFKAVIKAPYDEDNALRTSNGIILSKVRFKVSGSYTGDFNDRDNSDSDSDDHYWSDINGDDSDNTDDSDDNSDDDYYYYNY